MALKEKERDLICQKSSNLCMNYLNTKISNTYMNNEPTLDQRKSNRHDKQSKQKNLKQSVLSLIPPLKDDTHTQNLPSSFAADISPIRGSKNMKSNASFPGDNNPLFDGF